MSSLQNDWIVQEAPHFGAWEWTLAIDSKKLYVYFTAMHSFWTACETTGMWGLPSVYANATDYVQDAQAHFADFGVLHFASAGFLPRAANVYSRGNRLTFFDSSSNVRTAWVDDAGQLLRDLYPDLVVTKKHCMDLYPALRVWGERVASEQKVLTFGVLLHSNIWFPRLPFGLHSSDLAQDNSLLAAENAPSLNLWLAQVSDLVIELGGEVNFTRPAQKQYRSMIDLHGIVGLT
jgi:hypothetical protein